MFMWWVDWWIDGQMTTEMEMVGKQEGREREG